MNEPTAFSRDIKVIPSQMGRDTEGNLVLSFTTVLNCKVRNVLPEDRVEWILEGGNIFLFVNGKIVEVEEKLAKFGGYDFILDGKGQLVMRTK